MAVVTARWSPLKQSSPHRNGVRLPDSALGPDTAPGAAPLTPERLERLVDDWFRDRNQIPPGSLADRIRRILNDVRA